MFDLPDGSGRKGRVIMIIIPDKLRRPAEVEREELRKQLAEARAEIEMLNKNLRLLLCKTHFDKCEAGLFNSENPDDEPCLICLMEAAERGE